MKYLLMLGLAFSTIGLMPAFGRTVAWYQFNGQAVGEKTTSSTIIENAANPGVLQGKCYSTPEGSGSNKDVTLASDPNLMPRGVAGFGDSVEVYDPVTRVGSVRNTALHFGLDACTSSQATGDGSIVVVNGSQELAMSNITVEVIFRLVDTFPTTWNFCPLAMLKHSSTQEGWALAFGWNGKLAARFHLNDETTQSFQPGSAVVGTTGFNGTWHHAAFTFDENGTATLYLDYNSVASRDYPGKMLKTYTAAPLSIGAHLNREGRTFPGDISDVRISNEALSPSQFLRIGVQPRKTTPETAVYVPVTGYVPRTAQNLANLNAATNESAKVTYVADAAADDPLIDSVEKPNTATRFGIHDSPLVDNVASLHLVTNGQRTAVGLKLAGSQIGLFPNDFTFECFFKTDGQIVPSNVSGYSGDCSWTLYRSSDLQLCILPDTGRLMARMFKTGSNSWEDILTNERVDDGKWHHVALVWEESPRQRLYLDYAFVGKRWTETAKSTTANIHIGINASAGDRRPFCGWIDEIRFTRKALAATEFLTSHAVDTAEYRTLAHAAFDGDYTVLPYTTLTPAGVGVARTNGVASPVFVSRGRGDIVWDGENGTDVRADGGCIYMNGSQVQYPNFATLKSHGPYTVEWFMRLTSAENGVGLIRLNRTTAYFEGGNDNGIPRPEWMLYGNGTRLQFQANINGAQWYSGFPDEFPSRVTDGKWHHYALSVDEVEVDTGNGQTKPCARFEIWRDYRSYGAITNQNNVARLQIEQIPEDFSFTVCANNNFTGWFDELRVSEGRLPAEKFMRVAKRGMILIFR